MNNTVNNNIEIESDNKNTTKGILRCFKCNIQVSDESPKTYTIENGNIICDECFISEMDFIIMDM